MHYAESYGSISRSRFRSDVKIMKFSLVVFLSDVLSSLREDEEVLLVGPNEGLYCSVPSFRSFVRVGISEQAASAFLSTCLRSLVRRLPWDCFWTWFGHSCHLGRLWKDLRDLLYECYS